MSKAAERNIYTLSEEVIPEPRNGIHERDEQAKFISGWRMKWIHAKLKFSLILIALRSYRNPLDAFKSLSHLIKLRRRFLGEHRLRKMVSFNDKYYMWLFAPGWNGPVYRKFIEAQLDNYKPVKHKVNRFNTVFMAITKKCALQCEHCYEWENLNKKDFLTAENLSLMVNRLQQKGVSQIQFLGGEPLLKVDRLIKVLENTEKTTDFWVVTSGFKLTIKNAKALKKAGLTGVVVSLDHYIPAKHNEFRGFKDAYYWVEEAIKNAKATGLLTALSLCSTKSFTTESNLMSYMNTAARLGASFVQLLEPRAVGHYKGKDIMLQEKHIDLLEEIYIRMNFDPAFANYPIVTYHGYYQRRQGCFSAGEKGLYVDTDGDMNACPFCETKDGNLLDSDFEKAIGHMKRNGCPTYSCKTASS